MATTSIQSPAFDPAAAVLFDLEQGRVRRAEGEPVVVLTASVLSQLCATLEESQLRQLGGALGAQAGTVLQQRFGVGSSLTLPQLVESLGGEMSLAGLGSLSIERWGDALVVVLTECPLAASAPAVMGAYVEGALQALVERQVNAVLLESTENTFRLLLCGLGAAGKVKQWLADGRSFGDALASLQNRVSQGGA